jgi:hypothetical protein
MIRRLILDPCSEERATKDRINRRQAKGLSSEEPIPSWVRGTRIPSVRDSSDKRIGLWPGLQGYKPELLQELMAFAMALAAAVNYARGPNRVLYARNSMPNRVLYFREYSLEEHICNIFVAYL